MKRILFVDDEPMILQALQRMLRPMRGEWEMVFAEGGPAALEALAARPFDVVVTDMRMPGMDGAELLRAVRDRHPSTVRLVLSGHADRDLVTRCVGVAHQYIAKPCDAEQLKALVRNACLIGGDLVTDRVKEVLGSVDRLPTVPELYRRLEAALADPDSSSQALGAIIEQDMAMTAKVLKIVNSAFFGLRRSVASAREAVTLLGVDTLKTLVLGQAIFSKASALPTRHLCLEDLWRHALVTAGAARAIARMEGLGPQPAEEAFVGGLLGKVGILVLAGQFPEAYDRAIETLLAEHLLLTTVEREEFAVSHAEVGAYLLGLWGLPAPILRIVSQHHIRPPAGEARFGPERAVQAADILAGELGGSPVFRSGRFDPVDLIGRDCAGRVPAWREAVGRLQAAPPS
jgi:HD-like signal output (HDOD) protein